MLLEDIWSKEPDFINELGVKWWRDEYVTKIAQKEDHHGTTLQATCFYVEFPDGERTRVLVSKNQEVIEEDQTLEGMAVKIEVRKFLKRDEERSRLSGEQNEAQADY